MLSPYRIRLNLKCPKLVDHYSWNILKSPLYSWFKFFTASVCVGTASKKNLYQQYVQQYVLYLYYFSPTVSSNTVASSGYLLRSRKLSLRFGHKNLTLYMPYFAYSTKSYMIITIFRSCLCRRYLIMIKNTPKALWTSARRYYWRLSPYLW